MFSSQQLIHLNLYMFQNDSVMSNNDFFIFIHLVNITNLPFRMLRYNTN